MEQKGAVTNLRAFLEAYEIYCKPICRELGMPQMAFDILMFLANNPEFFTAKDISRFRGFKENIVSVNVNKLVSEGYLERCSVEEDRRKVRLVCTEKAGNIIERGRKAQESFQAIMTEGLGAEERAVFQHCMCTMASNAERLISQHRGIVENGGTV